MSSEVLALPMFRKDLWAGVETYIGFGLTPWRGVSAWIPEISHTTSEDPKQIETQLRAIWWEQRRREASWGYGTEGDRLDAVFAKLAKLGVYASMAWGCCTECHADAPAPPSAGPYWGECVFHPSEAAGLAHGVLRLESDLPSWFLFAPLGTRDQVRDLVATELRRAGFDIESDGSADADIRVRLNDWKHRMPE